MIQNGRIVFDLDGGFFDILFGLFVITHLVINPTIGIKVCAIVGIVFQSRLEEHFRAVQVLAFFGPHVPKIVCRGMIVGIKLQDGSECIHSFPATPCAFQCTAQFEPAPYPGRIKIDRLAQGLQRFFIVSAHNVHITLQMPSLGCIGVLFHIPPCILQSPVYVILPQSKIHDLSPSLGKPRTSGYCFLKLDASQIKFVLFHENKPEIEVKLIVVYILRKHLFEKHFSFLILFVVVVE